MYSRPTLADVVERVRTDVLSRLTTDDILRRADVEVYARVLGGVAYGLYGFVDYLANQLMYDTAEMEYLERWAALWKIARKPAVAAAGTVTFTVQVGALVPSLTLLQALDKVQYQTTADAVVVGTVATAPIAAVVPAAAGNRAAGQSLSLVSPVLGVQPTATAGLLSGGSDQESDVALRARFLARIQTPPQGGAAPDYVAWALQVPGVTRAWVYPLELGLGTVTVRFVRDGDGPGAAIIPDAAEVAVVQAYINSVRPVTAATYVLAPASVPLNFNIQGLVPATADVQAAVQAELQDLLLREAVPGGTLLLSHIRAAISAAAGETDFVLLAPTANVVCTTGNMSTMGSITWS